MLAGVHEIKYAQFQMRLVWILE